MNQWPTIFVSFKRVEGLDFQGAYDMLSVVISELYKKHLYLLDSDKVNRYDKEILKKIIEGKAAVKDIKNSLVFLTHVMRGIMQSLKDNSALRFAVITGCLKITKESIFTGMNNFVSDGIADSRLNEYFGFTQEEVDQILKYADAEMYAEAVREWYDGYHFGDVDVYCPWDVMNYIRDIKKNPQAQPASYWKNTSDNAIIRSFIDYAGSNITKQLETLLSGGYIVKQIDQNLTYDYLHSSEENLWSVLYLTGYLTKVRDKDLRELLPEKATALQIPNKEILDIYETTVMKWFADSAKIWSRKQLFDAVWNGDSETMTQEMNKLLRKTISYHDYKEDFYYAFLAGIFAGAGYTVEYEDDYDKILCYGNSFFKKRCLVKRK